MTMTERSTAVGVFSERPQAERAIAELHHAGFSDEQIGFVARNGDKMAESMGNGDTRAETVAGAATGAVSGGIIGGVAGAAASLLIPGLGPAIAGGILAAALGGAVLGAAAGGFAGALATMGVPEEEARYYESQLNSGRVILTVNAPGRYQDAVAILRANGAYDAGAYYSQRMVADNSAPANGDYTVQEAPGEVDRQQAGIVPGFGTYTHTIGPGVEHSYQGSQVEAPRNEPVPPGPGSLAHEYPQSSPENVPPGPGGVTREGTEGEAGDTLPRPGPDIYTPTAPGPGNPPAVPEETATAPSEDEETRKLKRPEIGPGGENIPRGSSGR
ncbi:MAG TPA: hypothetical protein VKY19_06165 [Ktedonosporobacter sp.]|jgi:hypothetical protein|nr:hypothetical protein [Ktedonosporobacter sp.]